MKNVINTIFAGSLVVVAYDAMAAAISAVWGISYGLFSIGSLLIYLVFGFLSGRKSQWFFGAIAGAVIGLTESTVGWMISWYIGPGKPTTEMNGLMITVAIIFVIVNAGILGLIGGLASLFLKRSA